MSKSFDVPQAVQAAAKRGLELRQKYGRGGLDTRQAKEHGVGSGVQRASNLMQGRVTYETVKRMLAFFNRHRKNKDSRTESGEPGAGMIAHLLWGGDAGYAWAKRIVAQEEKAEKGGFLSLVLFGAEEPMEQEQAVEEEPITSFSQLLQKARAKPTLEPIPDDEEFEYNGLVIPAETPLDAVMPTEAPLSIDKLDAIAQAESDEEVEQLLQKGVVEIDLNEDYVTPMKRDEEDSTLPAPELPPEPELGLEVVLTTEDHRALKKAVKPLKNIQNLDRAARDIMKHIIRGQWSKIDVNLVQSYLSTIDDPTDNFNALAVGGVTMLRMLDKALPKVPEKYLEGLKGEERAKRKREIQERMQGKHRGKKYDEMPGDKDAPTKPSKYSKTSFANKVREEIKGAGKDEFLRAASKVSGISRKILEEVYKRGAEAWATSGRRPGASQEAWARARVYSFSTGGRARRTADADLWREHKGS